MASQDSRDPETRLAELGLTLPRPYQPFANYVRAVRTGNLVILGGHGECEEPYTTGKVGADRTVDEGYAAARRTALCLLASLKAEIGDLRKVARIVRVYGMVNATESFTGHSQVINGCSDLLVDVFGERGRHARAAVGMASLPLDLTVEIEMFVEVTDERPVRSDRPQGGIEVVGEGVVSTSANQTFPAEDPMTGDLWFSVYEDSFAEQTIMLARKTDAGWATPEVAPFSGTWGDRAPRFTPDGTALYFTSNRPGPGEVAAGDMNIWRVQRREGGWTTAEVLPAGVNSSASDIHASITLSSIWVASNRAGGMGRSDLYRVDHDGSVAHPGAPLNDELSQPDVWVSPDESWMVLAITDRPGGYGGDDLYVSWREGDEWSPPVNLGPEVNSPEYEYGPWVSADGHSLLFTSHRDGSASVYRAPIALVRQRMQP